MKTFAIVGSWKPKKEADNSGLKHGFTVYSFDEKTGAMHKSSENDDWVSVGATYIDAVRGILYCTHETSNHPDCREGGGGLLIAYKINPENGSLTEINRKPSFGCNPSMVVVDPESKYLLASNYGFRTTITKTVKDAFGKFHLITDHDESNIVLFPLGPDGSIGDPVDIYQMQGEGPASFQISPHAHSIQRAPSGNLYVVCDKGGDQVMMFRIDYAAQKLILCPGGHIKSEPAAAPRYSTFHPTEPYFVYNKENKTIITACKYDEQGAIEPVCTVSALPANLEDPKKLSQSDIVFGKDGKYLYDLLRIVEIITVFKFEAGQMKLIQTKPVSAAGPRGCKLSPDGRFLLVAALQDNKVEIYPIGQDGLLGDPTSVDSVTPGNIAFFQV